MIIFGELQQVKELITQLFFTNYHYLKEHYKWILTVLSKQQALDTDPKAMQQINFLGNLVRVEAVTMFVIIEEAKEILLEFSQGNVNVY